MSTQDELFKKIVSHAKEYGFVFPSSEIYEGLGAVYDYGQYGSELKNNIRSYWWKSMVQIHENIVGIDAGIFMAPKVWKASGHVDSFSDPLIDNKDSKKRYRADVLIEDYIAKIEDKINSEVEKASKRFGDSFDPTMYRSTNPRVQEYQNKIDQINLHFKAAMDTNDWPSMKALIVDLEIADPISGSRNWSEVRQFNLMFATQMGALSDQSDLVYLRPETAQGIFVNYLNVQKTGRMKIPFGIAQVGKAFRNEIVARQWIFRMREFEQMEMQFFIKPGTEMEWYNYWKDKRLRWHLSLGIESSKYRYHDHLKLAHYANAACDIEFEFPFGFKELEGIHSRTDFDLGRHSEFSGKKLQYFDTEKNESYTPYVVETSIGLDRMFLAVFSNSYKEERLEDGSIREMLCIPPILAPIKLTILPLVKKDGLGDKARKIFEDLRFEFMCQFDEKDAIGRRYRRQDAIGTPFCITVDHQTLEDDTVTLRYRDTMEQVRLPINAIKDRIGKELNVNEILRKI
jgi:glycyl-tRNA synthetase